MITAWQDVENLITEYHVARVRLSFEAGQLAPGTYRLVVGDRSRTFQVIG